MSFSESVILSSPVRVVDDGGTKIMFAISDKVRKTEGISAKIGSVVEIGSGSNEGRIRVLWDTICWTPCTSKIVKKRYVQTPTGEPEQIRPARDREAVRTWVAVSSVTHESK